MITKQPMLNPSKAINGWANWEIEAPFNVADLKISIKNDVGLSWAIGIIKGFIW